MNVSVDVRNIQDQERQSIKQTFLNLGWELDIRFERMSLDSSYIFAWRKDTQPIYPENIDYSVIN